MYATAHPRYPSSLFCAWASGDPRGVMDRDHAEQRAFRGVFDRKDEGLILVRFVPHVLTTPIRPRPVRASGLVPIYPLSCIQQSALHLEEIQTNEQHELA